MFSYKDNLKVGWYNCMNPDCKNHEGYDIYHSVYGNIIPSTAFVGDAGIYCTNDKSHRNYDKKIYTKGLGILVKALPSIYFDWQSYLQITDKGEISVWYVNGQAENGQSMDIEQALFNSFKLELMKVADNINLLDIDVDEINFSGSGWSTTETTSGFDEVIIDQHSDNAGKIFLLIGKLYKEFASHSYFGEHFEYLLSLHNNKSAIEAHKCIDCYLDDHYQCTDTICDCYCTYEEDEENDEDEEEEE